MVNLLTRIFGTANERILKRLWPVVEKINEEYEKLRKIQDDDLPRKKTEEFRERLKAGETPDDLLVEAYAVVKDACRRLLGKSWEVTGHMWEWNMVPYDVQLLGAIVLHQGKIAEMATGEGKTLVATMPLYLNSLTGKNCHLVTVNDYLARRDKEWMSGLYEKLGVTVGVIQAGMSPQDRRPQYECDITYGTNNEFGFDYLRDNMVLRIEDKVQRGHFYAIVDEVDSILIDEARTPLIISGPVEFSINREYERLNPRVRKVYHMQVALVNKLVSEAEKLMKEGKTREAALKLLIAKRGAPKHKRLLRLLKEQGMQKIVEQIEAEYMRDKKLHELDEQLYFAVEEKSNVVNISEMGRKALAPEDPDFFTVPDLTQMFREIDEKEGLSARERAIAKFAAQKEFAEKSEQVHAINQLLRAYTLFERDVEYVVQNGQVIIVDEFTGRLMPGRRYSDGLHQALEAKEGVRIEEETQTLATITLQNYFRMYEKLAGMTGTAATESEEFWNIYKLEVVTIPTNKPVRRVVFPDKVYKTKRAKYKAIMQEIEEVHKTGRPILVGTTSVEVSELLSRMLQRKGIKHQVLNAKYHQREAEIVALAGQKGKVTIATNMAGRGTDIKLGPGVVKCKQCCINCEYEKLPGGCAKNCPDPEKKGKKMTECLKNPPCGLHIIGTERHEARRIDNQLIGRCARQGDPGSARFYLSLEDDLMRLFGGEKLITIMDRWGAPEDEPIEHPMVTKAIEGAQKRVEKFHFSIRKHLLEYDDVMNKQRDTIYKLRDQILMEEDISDYIKRVIEDTVDLLMERYIGKNPDEWQIDALQAEVRDIFLLEIPTSTLKETTSREELRKKLLESINALYKLREQDLGAENMRMLERQVALQVLDRLWREHLYELDALKEGIGLRGYAQRDPLVEFKHEAFNMFEELLENINKETVRHLFGLRVMPVEREKETQMMVAYKPEVQRLQDVVRKTQPQPTPVGTPVGAPVGTPVGAEEPEVKTFKRNMPKVGRNDPCPCGSGKKYKHCCGRGIV